MWVGRNQNSDGDADGNRDLTHGLDAVGDTEGDVNFPISQSQYSQYSQGDDDIMDYLTPQEPSQSQSYLSNYNKSFPGT